MRGGEEDCFVLLIAAGDVKTNISLQSVLSIVQGRHCDIIPHTPPSCNHSNIYQTTNINLSCRLCQLDVLRTCDLIRNNRGGQHSTQHQAVERVLMKPIRIFPKEFLAQQAICYSSSLPGAEVEKLEPRKLQPREGRQSFPTNNCPCLLSYVGRLEKYRKLPLLE